MLDFDAEYSRLIRSLWGLNEVMSNPLARRSIATCFAKQQPTFPEYADLGRPAADALSRDGFHVVGAALSAAELAHVGEHFAACRVYDAAPPPDRGDRVERAEYALADRPPWASRVAYKIEEVLRCAPLVQLACRPDIVGAVHAYLGCAPTLVDFSVGHRFPDPAGAPGERFHRDRDCFRSVRLLVYLTPVDADGGAHQYIRHSHSPEALQGDFAQRGVRTSLPPLFEGDARQLDPQHVQQMLGARVVDFAGPAGFALLEDSYGLNRDLPPRGAPRLAFTAAYAPLALRLANRNDRDHEMARRASFSRAGLDAPTNKQRYLFRYFLGEG